MKDIFSKKHIYIVILFLLLGLLIGLGNIFLFSVPSEKEVIILHTNDEHGIIDNFGRIAYKKQKLKEEYKDVLLVSAGDIFGGNPVVDQYSVDGKDLRGRPMVDLMNMAGYDLLTIGNHEFDYGQERLQEVINRASFPVILANIEVGEAATIKQPPPGVILETATGRRISFLGLLQLGRGGIPSTHPAHLEGLSFIYPYRAAQEYLSSLKDVDLSVALTHLGYSSDLELANRFSGLDLIIGGHSHRVIPEPEEVNGVYVTQAGANTEYLGKIKVVYDQEKISALSGKLIPVEEIEETVPEVETKIEEFRADMEEEMESVLHYFQEAIRGKESLGSLMTDALVDVHGLDIAFQQDGGIRLNSLPPLVTRKDVYQLDPFNNNIVVRHMNSEEIASLIYDFFVRYDQIDLRVSGLDYRVQVDETGSVTEIILSDSTGEPLADDRQYRVGMNSYLAETYFADFPADREEILYADTTAEALIKYLENREILKDYNREQRTGIEISRQGEETQKPVLANISFPISTGGKKHEQVTAGSLMAEAAGRAVNADIGTYPSDQLTTNVSLSPGLLYEGILDIIYESFSYNNNIILMEITGRELEKLFLSQVNWYQGTYPFQVSAGTEYEIIKEDDVVQEVIIYHQGERIRAEEIYSVAVNSFKFDYYQREVEVVGYSDSGITEKDALLDYLRRHITVFSGGQTWRMVLCR